MARLPANSIAPLHDANQPSAVSRIARAGKILIDENGRLDLIESFYGQACHDILVLST